jgi:signal transduction histidine kinase
VAHELRQPLNAIKLAARNLQRITARDQVLDVAGLSDRLDRINRNVDRADRVISALRMLSRNASGDRVWFEISAALRELVMLQSDVIEAAGVQLVLDLEAGLSHLAEDGPCEFV